MQGDQPTYRDLWLRIRDHLPKKGRKTEELDEAAQAPRRAGRGDSQPLRQLRKVSRALGEERRRPGEGTDAARLHRRLQQHQRLQARLQLHRRLGENRSPTARRSSSQASCRCSATSNGRRWSHRPNTILVDSEQLESGEAHERRVQEDRRPRDRGVQGRVPRPFPRPRRRQPLRRRPAPREVMNTVGKPGKLGEHVKCVVSVSMLTEGWDANTVTHVLGVRAFGTQLLCEQVVGRALRRMSYAANDERAASSPNTPRSTACRSRSSPVQARSPDPKPGPMPTRVRALESRIACEITFPRLLGYRYEMPGKTLPCQVHRRFRCSP